MTTAAEQRAYRIEDLSHASGTTVRTIRAYTDRGLLPKPERRGRANLYAGTHLARLRQIADLLERGYTLASIKELLAAWDDGTGLGGVLGVVDPVNGPRADVRPTRITRAELVDVFGGLTDPAVLREAVRLGVPVPVPLPPATVAAVQALVGAEHVAAFVAAAADREVAGRRMDALTGRD